MNALAKRISHPKWETVDQVLEILEKGVNHPQWARTKIEEQAGEAIINRFVGLPPPQDAQTLERVNNALGRLIQKRSFARLGFPAKGIFALLDSEHAMKKKGQPWMTSVAENSKNGAFAVAYLCPEAFEQWVGDGLMKPQTEQKIALNYLRKLKQLPEFQEKEDQKTTYMRLGVLNILERMAGRGQDRPDVWSRMVEKFDFTLERLDTLEQQTKKKYPKLRSGLTRALLYTKAQQALPDHEQYSSPSSPKM